MKRRNGTVPHGTKSRYDAGTATDPRPCRCPACREANTAYGRQRRSMARARLATRLLAAVEQATFLVRAGDPAAALDTLATAEALAAAVKAVR